MLGHCRTGLSLHVDAGRCHVKRNSAAANGQLTLLSPATGTDPGTVDASASLGGQYLYVQTGGNGIVDEFQVNANGSLLEIGTSRWPVLLAVRASWPSSLGPGGGTQRRCRHQVPTS